MSNDFRSAGRTVTVVLLALTRRMRETNAFNTGLMGEEQSHHIKMHITCWRSALPNVAVRRERQGGARAISLSRAHSETLGGMRYRGRTAAEVKLVQRSASVWLESLCVNVKLWGSVCFCR